MNGIQKWFRDKPYSWLWWNGKESFPKAMEDKKIDLDNKRLRISEYISDMDVCLAAEI